MRAVKSEISLVLLLPGFILSHPLGPFCQVQWLIRAHPFLFFLYIRLPFPPTLCFCTPLFSQEFAKKSFRLKCDLLYRGVSGSVPKKLNFVSVSEEAYYRHVRYSSAIIQVATDFTLALQIRLSHLCTHQYNLLCIVISHTRLT